MYLFISYNSKFWCNRNITDLLLFAFTQSLRLMQTLTIFLSSQCRDFPWYKHINKLDLSSACGLPSPTSPTQETQVFVLFTGFKQIPDEVP